MDKELEILMQLVQQVRDENDYFTPKQLWIEMKKHGFEIRSEPNALQKVGEKAVEIISATKSLIV